MKQCLLFAYWCLDFPYMHELPFQLVWLCWLWLRAETCLFFGHKEKQDCFSVTAGAVLCFWFGTSASYYFHTAGCILIIAGSFNIPTHCYPCRSTLNFKANSLAFISTTTLLNISKISTATDWSSMKIILSCGLNFVFYCIVISLHSWVPTGGTVTVININKSLQLHDNLLWLIHKIRIRFYFLLIWLKPHKYALVVLRLISVNHEICSLFVSLTHSKLGYKYTHSTTKFKNMVTYI